MIIDESLWIKDKLDQLDLPPGSRIIDIGSSTAEFRQSAQPHIFENVFLPLQKRGFHVLHMDAKSAEGVDIVGNIEDVNIAQKIGERFDLVICTNLLEHLTDVEKAVESIVHLVSQNGYLLITAPNKYPKHNDPIDTMYRPSDKELQELFSKHACITVISSEIIAIRNRRYYIYGSRYPFWGYRKFWFWRYYLKAFRWKLSCLLIKVSLDHNFK